MRKHANTDYSIHELLAGRWSPYGFAERPVAPADLRALFEAARWAPSSYNEQPWRYIVATRAQPDEHARIVSCLAEGNQGWAHRAPVLALGVVARHFRRSGKPNKAAVHDLGAASASLTFEAAARGLLVHQMIGIHPEKAREEFAIPEEEGFEAFTGLAIGYPETPEVLPEALRERDHKPRERISQSAFVFAGRFGVAAEVGE